MVPFPLSEQAVDSAATAPDFELVMHTVAGLQPHWMADLSAQVDRAASRAEELVSGYRRLEVVSVVSGAPQTCFKSFQGRAACARLDVRQSGQTPKTSSFKAS